MLTPRKMTIVRLSTMKSNRYQSSTTLCVDDNLTKHLVKLARPFSGLTTHKLFYINDLYNKSSNIKGDIRGAGHGTSHNLLCPRSCSALAAGQTLYRSMRVPPRIRCRMGSHQNPALEEWQTIHPGRSMLPICRTCAESEGLRRTIKCPWK